MIRQLELEQKIDNALTKATDAAKSVATLREKLKALKSNLSAKPDENRPSTRWKTSTNAPNPFKVIPQPNGPRLPAVSSEKTALSPR